MTSPIEFYFDFSSPYAYLASTRIDALASEWGRTVCWRPVLLGPIFKQTGTVPLAEVPLKGTYMLRDLVRTARLFNIRYVQPTPFPVATVKAARAMLWIERDSGPAQAREFARRIFRAYFTGGQNIGEQKIVMDTVRQTGLDPELAARAIEEESIKTALRNQIADAMARGVFGAPFMFVDDEPFWGFDHLAHIEKWLEGKKAKAAGNQAGSASG